MEPTEYVISTAPFTVRRKARWVECDPAGIVYAGVFPEYVISATHLLRDHLFGRGWIDIFGGAGVQTPAKALSLIFQSSLRPDDIFEMTVFVSEIRERSWSFFVRARRPDGAPVFEGSLTCICRSPSNERASVAIPAKFRDLLDAYRSANPPPVTPSETMK